MTPLIKVGIVAGTCTTLAGLGYVGGICSAPNLKISTIIDKEDMHLLLNTKDEEDNNYWTNNWNNYKNQKGNVFGLVGWKDNDNSLNLKKELKQKCASLKDYFVYSKEDELYKNVTNYCARYQTVEDEAKKEGLKILDTKKDEPKGIWEQKNKTKEQLKDHIEKLDIDYSKVDAEKIKEGCGNAKIKNKELENFLDIYNSYVAICTIGA